MIRRGDICWADLGEPRGSAPAKHRPVVVVQADSYNMSRLATAVVVALTSNTRLAEHPGNVFLPASATGLARDSVAKVTQVATLDKSTLSPGPGPVPIYLLDEIDNGLRLVLAL